MKINEIKRLALLVIVTAFVSFIGGCGTDIIPSGDVTEKESNDTFGEAEAVAADENDSVKISGSLSYDDCDVFLLGTFQAGAKINVRIRAVGGTTKYASVALFDGDQNVAWLEEDFICKSTYADVFTYTAYKDSDFYLAICKSGDTSYKTLNYEVVVNTGSTIPPLPTGQTVYVDFNGIDYVNIGGIQLYNLKPFSEIDMSYTPRLLAEDILDIVEADYSGYKITFISSYNQAAPTGEHSTVYVTASKGDYYGLAEDVDWYDENKQDNAVVFAGVMTLPGISRTQFVQLVANVLSHEVGHLVGLVHTDDDTEIMDQVTPTAALEQDQIFGRSPLASDEFPIGYQDALELLAFSIGLL